MFTIKERDIFLCYLLLCCSRARQHLIMFLFQSPTTMILSGATGSGKTTWLKSLLDHRKDMFFSPPERILYFYGTWQPLFEEMEKSGVEFIEGLPPQDIENQSGKPMVVILDDLLEEATKSDVVERLFTKGSHHKNMTVIYLTQNLFRQGKNARNITLNAHYLVLFKNPRDVGQVGNVGKQLGCSSFLKKAFEDATAEKYGYLVIDLSPHTEAQYRYRTHVFPSEDTLIYRPL